MVSLKKPSLSLAGPHASYGTVGNSVNDSLFFFVVKINDNPQPRFNPELDQIYNCNQQIKEYYELLTNFWKMKNIMCRYCINK